MTFRVGILGGGNISRTHTQAALEVDGVEVVAVYGENADKVRRLAEISGGSAYGDLESFLNHPSMEVVLIGSPSGLHAEQGVMAAERGIHVLVEKPIAVTTEQADGLIAACEKAVVKLGVFFQDRVAPDIVRLKQFLDAGRLGKPFLASARVNWYRPPDYYKSSRWRGTWALDGGGALMNQGVHTVDLLLWLIGSVRSVSAKALTAVHDIEVEDTVVAAFEFSNGAVGTLQAATSVYPGYPRRLEVTGSQGTIIVENDHIIAADLREPAPELLGGESLAGAQGPDARSVSPAISDTRGHRTVLEDFLRAIATDGAPLCDGHQARCSVELVQAIYESSRLGQSVPLFPAR